MRTIRREEKWTIQEWLQNGHRGEVDRYVRDKYKTNLENDDEREDWVLNEEYLYCLAIADGVDI